ncbi:trifunctional transcriptional regulator/proline dehydrogenase/L-glutamate gamma-semialdehyde dehydrogenase [Kaistia algarum]|uniref:trifunctional transcriptional regulator/proline dehydrogenase/L-glutamate gamma-semialdehyde dehydrogenase n=1 Tax=Kaistia algarum TaxID=2083279 RepID=UPI000CE8ABE4|nr:trifunctional transcriptional regulator/proline dehydrogenase/L-glutamate gamma-semialdehyde dehydrogenase [Kaistia algarum]MCX5514085.1 trifunctional transcriptional regulator/proline dehydrogenase/L-glutamate gamma-semialdehyde dehydrogenase [Kaistia algarum]PPE77321.1 trifunctional transcriptional regulator/proline dehydrogenase/L-glutamate gamma-semialdehyde dehydrogenase [Kaistia algarum]
MGTTTIGIKVDEEWKARLQAAAAELGKSPHALAKQGLLMAITDAEGTEAGSISGSDSPEMPFLDLARSVRSLSLLRARIAAAARRPELECMPLLISEAALPDVARAEAAAIAGDLVERLRAKPGSGRVEGLIREYALSTQEGVALMCLAEALLRIPDRATRDALIRDKIAAGDWSAHVGQSPSLFVNAATWGLVVTGRLTGTSSEEGLSSALSRLIGRGGEGVIRKGVEIAMRLMGEQFVTGQTIGEALANSRRMEAKGFRYSYDMLGEAAMTAADADHYFAAYEQAIHAIGKAAGRRGIYEGPGISIKLSALHPRYSRAQAERVMVELLPRLTSLARLARRYDIGLNIDAEEADRLELSLDLLEALCFDAELEGWNGIGFVIQAYGKRCPFVIDYLIDLGRRSRRRLMVRLVKGAYWDSEIKRAQEAGLEDFPVFTRKLHTDVSYLACARRLLAAPDAIFPQFATHNAQTLATIMKMAGANFYAGQYEFQCLHGMGEPLYEEVVGADRLGRPCRIYAPVGTHETLLAYLVRRLLENGANTSFVNRVSDPAVPIEDLVADPVAEAAALVPMGSPHPSIRPPRHIHGARINSLGLDLASEPQIATLAAHLVGEGSRKWQARPMVGGEIHEGKAETIRNPADRRDVVGSAVTAATADIASAFDHADAVAPIWSATPAAERAAILRRAADRFEAAMISLIGLLVREAGKTIPNAVSEVREAVDFLRFYADEAERADDGSRPLGPTVCISPWNFPLAIFTGQIAAALAAGNPVLAKPAEETPLVAAEAIRILRSAGIPPAALQLLPGEGDVGAALVADPRTRAVLFTGSTEVARRIQASLAERLTPEGRNVPLVAETGGLNVMIVDSSALAEQVTADVLQSAFDSAGQRCSALRILCLQEDIADRTIEMILGAMAELTIGKPDRLSTDIGPVIRAEAAALLSAHIAAMAERGFRVHSLPLPPETATGSFVPPALIEIGELGDVEREVFGPVLHVLRYRRNELPALIEAVNATGYGLTFGLHTRIDETIAAVTGSIRAGNIYVNRNIVGAVVGVQPFGGNGLSGTGPKAGGPLYLQRLGHGNPAASSWQVGTATNTLVAYLDWLKESGLSAAATSFDRYRTLAPSTRPLELPGPVGERNEYRLRPRGRLLVQAETETGFHAAVAAALATGNRPVLPADAPFGRNALPTSLQERVFGESERDSPVAAVLFEGGGDALIRLQIELAALDGPIIPVHAVSPEGLAAGREDFPLAMLVEEMSISTNTAAAGGNASLMTIG